MKRAVISAENLSIGYVKTTHGQKAGLYDGLSLQLFEGELTCLLGLNGAGKSTLLRTLSAMQPALHGDVLLNGKSVFEYKEPELSCILGLVLTDKTSVGGLTVRQLVGLGRYPYTGFFGRLSSHDHAVIDNAMNDVCISHKASSYVAELSDGERQKAMIAKALAQECPILFLDEPTAFLDVASRIEIMNLLHNLASRHNKTILLSTHDMELAFLLADRLWLLSRDKGMKCGVTEDMILDDTLNLFFNKEGVVFDKHTGSFLPDEKVDKYIHLDAENDVRHWAVNFLRRNRIGIAQNEQDAVFRLKVVSYDRMMVTGCGNETEFYSFDELLSWIYKQKSSFQIAP